MIIRFFLFLSFIAVTSCSLAPNPKDFKSKDIKSNYSNYAWKSIDPDNADVAFVNNINHSTMLLNSYCKKYEGTSIEKSVENLVSGITNLEVENTDKQNIFGREAVHAKLKAKIDGVEIFLNLITVKKDGCTYDFIHISTDDKVRTSDENDFNNFTNSVNL